MIHREIEEAFANWISAGVSGTSLAGVSIRHGVPATDLALPCVIVQANGSEVLEGGARAGSRIDLDLSVISAASNAAGWQTAHKNRVAALTRRVDDTNTNTALASINAAQSDFTVYGWAISELSSETNPNHQADSVRLSVVAGDRVASAPTGPTNASPQSFSLRHEIEQILTAHLASELPGSVTSDYSVQPCYNENAAESLRIVSSCTSATKPFPQFGRYRAEATIEVITNGADSVGHVAIVRSVQNALRALTAQGFTSANVTVAGVIESSHGIQRSQNYLSDSLGLSLWAQIN